MKPPVKPSAVLVAMLLLAGCAPTPVKPFAGPPDRSRFTEDQKVVWQASDDQDTAFENSGATLDDPTLQAYLQGVVNRMYPEFNGAIRVHLLKSTVPNAFMMGNGSCYVNLGILPLLQDEAQLAMVLGHEGIHFVNQHGVAERGYASSTAATGMILGVIVPIIAPAIAYSSIFGYSRDMETQADQQGYMRFLRAGYDPEEAVAPFVALDQYSQAMAIKESYFYADHPKLQSRIAYFKAKAADSTPTGVTGRAAYVEATQAARLWVLQELQSRRDYKALIFFLEDKSRLAEYPAWADYYLGRAYELRASEGDAARAEAIYRNLVATSPAFAPAYAALGETLMRKGSDAEATRMFQTYVKLAPAAPDRAYIEAYLKQLSAKPGNGN
ncbi:MAG TPA: M48 family metalloprotease [Gammaproteobacteria bacterium]|nr:M48 family metalloprotease [Gammaproteobacteria bacterium]